MSNALNTAGEDDYAQHRSKLASSDQANLDGLTSRLPLGELC